MILKINEHIYKSARDLYNDKLHYHNFGHVIDVLDNAKTILKECDSNNIAYDTKVICHAILFHDAGYYLDHLKKGFDNKEACSAFLAETILFDSGECKRHIKEVTQAVLCTHMNAVCESTNEMVVRAADLLGMVAPYSQFKSKAIDLYKERELITGEAIAWEQYRDEAANVIRIFLKPPIKLNIDLFSGDNCIFRTKILENVDKLIKDTID